jgi:hypothetical protein
MKKRIMFFALTIFLSSQVLAEKACKCRVNFRSFDGVQGLEKLFEGAATAVDGLGSESECEGKCDPINSAGGAAPCSALKANPNAINTACKFAEKGSTKIKGFSRAGASGQRDTGYSCGTLRCEEKVDCAKKFPNSWENANMSACVASATWDEIKSSAGGDVGLNNWGNKLNGKYFVYQGALYKIVGKNSDAKFLIGRIE